eukprot:CAMPEP_0119103402 /NCGR_PEP_ID=MMETSP1180-20130426/1841_1 /TAXON_ID=3052 ORGANISM="Chlamydomonas cf sp, Strain CCMP681" /NCGR_SAMPLE_ID=MMETSP1180 /ASSEMBLY_ACC=CAM_ASM_000741 /LENGTH=158 /DNA_ID=CAMNT_0007087889 /DNA_START=934 /DNA_END=1410 /DNA_ORIENTATION=+
MPSLPLARMASSACNRHLNTQLGSPMRTTNHESTCASHAASYARSAAFTATREGSTASASSSVSKGLNPLIHPSKSSTSSGPSTLGQVPGAARSPRPAWADLSYLGTGTVDPGAISCLSPCSVAVPKLRSWVPALPRNFSKAFVGLAVARAVWSLYVR